MDIQVNDIIEMKKPHPCGGFSWLVLRLGIDFRIKCLTCGHEVLAPRRNIEKRIKKVSGPDKK